MAVSACPIGTVAAAADTVWSFLAAPERLDLWWDARVERVEPPGPMAAGQRIDASSRAFGHRFRVWFTVDAVDAASRRLQLTAHLPFGIVDQATLSVTPIDATASRLSFG